MQHEDKYITLKWDKKLKFTSCCPVHLARGKEWSGHCWQVCLIYDAGLHVQLCLDFCLYALIMERKTFYPCLADKVYPLHETQTAKICFGFEKATQSSSVKKHVNVMCQRHCLFPWQQMEACSIMQCRLKSSQRNLIVGVSVLWTLPNFQQPCGAREVRLLKAL